MFLKIRLTLFSLILILVSCQKAAKVEGDIKGTWERVIFNHNGTEQWIFTADKKIYITLTLPNAVTLSGGSIDGDTVCEGSFTTKIVNYSHGTLLNKNIFRVPELTISGLSNYKYSGSNLDFTSSNTVWQVHKLDANVLILTTDIESGIPGGLVEKEFYKN